SWCSCGWGWNGCPRCARTRRRPARPPPLPPRASAGPARRRRGGAIGRRTDPPPSFAAAGPGGTGSAAGGTRGGRGRGAGARGSAARAGAARRALAGLEAEERARTGVGSVRVGYNRVFEYYWELPQAQAAKAPPEYEPRQTLTNAQRYRSAELSALESRILSAK